MSDHSKWLFRIEHILEAINRIETYTEKTTVIEFSQNRMMRDAVERNFEIIGEAVIHIPTQIKEKHQQIPWHKMKAMRNFIVHQYDEVEEIAVWNTIKNDLPDLKEKILTILKEND